MASSILDRLADGRPDEFALDVVGIGALNLDYIVGSSTAGALQRGRSMTARISEFLERSGARLEWGVEHQVDSDTIHAVIEAASSSHPDASLGGSAFNAIHAIARTNLGLRLGYVGVAGRVPVIGMSGVRQLEAMDVDTSMVKTDDEHLCGVCFSFSEEGDRTLLTHAGANQYMADYLDGEADKIVRYLLRARVIHVTSFLDDRTAERLASVLKAVRDAGRGNLICFDPGHVWSVEATEEIEEIVRISDYLLLNNREFHELGGQLPGETDTGVAARLLGRMESPGAVIMVKRPAGVWAHRRKGDAVTSDFYAHTPLSEDQVEDATGAGDVFAAGLLCVLTCDRMQIELGALLGMQLARHKLRYTGNAGHAQFPRVTQDFIRSLDAERRAGARPSGIFIAHGTYPEWLAVQRFVEERFDCPVYSFESSPWGGHQMTEALTKYLDRCSFAVCVLTAEDVTSEGRTLARQNVIHEVGLFQGRHGFDRVALLVEEGCDFVPEPASQYMLPFPHNRINRTFYQLGEIIRSRGFSLKEHS